jgi:hypothetical protein
MRLSLRCLILGGAALQRCDNWITFTAGFNPLRWTLVLRNYFFTSLPRPGTNQRD